jgi:hypothetical protein
MGRPSKRATLELAIENAVEGCVRETFGAALALWQADHAMDPQIRSTMAAIAEDEAEHAQLAWDIAAWLEPRLSEVERDSVRKAKAEAIAALGLGVTQAPPFAERLGLPDAVDAAHLLEEVGRQVWWA